MKSDIAKLIESKIFIYGMGKVGIKIFMLLRDNGYDIEGFIDSDYNKQKCKFEGKGCISIDQLLNMRDSNYLVIVAIEDGLKVKEKLLADGMENVIFYKELPDIISVHYEKIADINKLNNIYQCLCEEI